MYQKLFNLTKAFEIPVKQNLTLLWIQNVSHLLVLMQFLRDSMVDYHKKDPGYMDLWYM